jgi:hypothetical protein
MALRLCTAFALALIALPAIAHVDSIVQWNEDERLESLPSEFQPAKLHVTFAPREDRLKGVEAFALNIASHRVTLPQCVTSSIRVLSRDTVRVVASWYHDLSRNPPYILVELFEADPQSTSPKRSHVLLFNLLTARLVEVQAVRYAAHGSVISPKKVDFRAACVGEDLEAFSERREDHRPNKSLERTRDR